MNNTAPDERLTGDVLIVSMKEAAERRDEYIKEAAREGARLYMMARLMGLPEIPEHLQPHRQVIDILKGVGIEDEAEVQRLSLILDQEFSEVEKERL